MGDVVPFTERVPRRLGPDQLAEVLAEAADAIARIRRDADVLLARAKETADERGYPSRSMGDGRGSGVVDPIGDLVAREADYVDPLRTAVARMCALVVEARAALRAADAARASCWPRERSALEPEGVCLNCWRFEREAPVHKAGRCRACYDYRLRHDGADAQADIVGARDELVARRKSAHAS
jgi:hypothetical protein